MAEVTTDVGICNLALVGHLGSNPISSLGESTKQGQLCDQIYEATRNALLRSHPWNFAVTRVALAQDSDATDDLTDLDFEFDYAYTLPADCLKVLRTQLEAEGCDDEYRIEGRFLLSNESSVSIEYIKKATTVGEYDPLFVQTLALMLAVRMCSRMTDNAALKQALQAELKELQQVSQSVDGQEGTPRPIVDNDGWINARL